MFQPDRKQQLIILILAAVILFGAGYKYAQWQGNKAPEEDTPALEPFNQGGGGGEAREIVIHVDGAVEKPGVYRLTTGARVADALDRAVARPDADLGALNLALVLKDGQKVPVPFKQLPVEDGPGAAGGVPPGAARPVNAAPAGVVNINTAGAEELEKLPGIGPSLALRIIQYREANGPFATPEDIKNVSGIGEKKYDQLKDFISN